MYLFDENTSPKLVAYMRECGAADVTHLSEVYARGTLDPELIPAIAEAGYILVTNDQAMRDEHSALLEQSRIKALFLPPGWADMRRWGQSAFIFRYWPTIAASVNSNPGMGSMRIDKKGNVTTLATNYRRGHR